MQVGSLRENIIIALLISNFGKQNVNTDVPITKSEVDVYLNDKPISIKTINGSGGIKLIWTVDAKKAQEFVQNYIPKIDIILTVINWGAEGGFYLIPTQIQKEIFNEIGRDNYFKLPRPGTNPRGVELSKIAQNKILGNDNILSIDIFWEKGHIDYDPYKRWVDYWEEE